MINTQIIEHTIKLAIYSTIIKDERPISIMILAKPEHGKSEILKKFAFIKTVHLTTDFNTFIFADFVNDYQSKGKRTIIIPDFLRVVKRKYSTQSACLTIINSLTEEGWIGKLPMGQLIDKPVIGNLITALTSDEIVDKRHKWAKLGFMSRFIPLSFSYNKETKQLIRGYIKDRIYHTDNPFDFELPKDKIDVIMDKKYTEQIEQISLGISEENNLTGFRLQRQLQVLAMANAVSNGRNLVLQDDIDTIKEITKFINFNFVEI